MARSRPAACSSCAMLLAVENRMKRAVSARPKSRPGVPPQFPSSAKDAMSNSVVATVGVLEKAVTQGLPAQVAAATKDTAFTAFLDASHVTTLISASLALVACLVVWFMLPPITPPKKGAMAPTRVPTDGEASTDQPHALVTGAHTRDEADLGAVELEDSYAREAAEEYAAQEAARAAAEPDKA
jgi:hypothetical protein